MSDRAQMKMDNGEWKPISILKLTLENVKSEFRCGGPIKDTENCYCYAPMNVAVRKNDKIGYFYEATRKFPHAKGCVRMRHSKESVASHVDHRAAGWTKEECIAKALRGGGRRNRKKHPAPQTVPTEDGLAESGATKAIGEERETVNKTRGAYNLRKLAGIMQELNVDDIYADQPVRNFIVDFRTFSHYFEHGIPEGESYLILGKLVTLERAKISREKDEWVLADCTYKAHYADKNDLEEYNSKHLFFRFQTDKNALKKLVGFAKSTCRKQNNLVVVCATWVRDKEKGNLYVATEVNSERVAFLNKKKIKEFNE